MAIEEFTWCPRINAEADTNFRVRKAKFGDGYEQVSGDGLNPKSQEWTLNFTGDQTYISAIKSFLDEHNGTKAFQWKPPLEQLGLYRSETYKPTALGSGKFNLEVTFIQAFRP
ncbi:phage tail protein [Kluyvera cryocrescens]|uniref:Phage tail protein n=1 Tax=Kluyvera cryocrescens TaxID=580 RepID=A0AAW9CFE9_KLUCR|nr:phage tail protein [Kluyvera cryocrescens]MDW3780578.1 phage tail protein [Kluyvera cryocrescens]